MLRVKPSVTDQVRSAFACKGVAMTLRPTIRLLLLIGAYLRLRT